jgi:hypothetical protein
MAKYRLRDYAVRQVLGVQRSAFREISNILGLNSIRSSNYIPPPRLAGGMMPFMRRYSTIWP